MGGRLSLAFAFVIVLFDFIFFEFAAANVVVIGKNVTLSFDDVEANFASPIKASGECGVLYVAEPLDACTHLTKAVGSNPNPPFALIVRGGCTFDEKVRNAQIAGFKAAIVYDNEDSDVLISMAGTPGGIHIHAIFVSKASGEKLKEYAGRTDMEFWILPNNENSAWSIMAISFISLLAVSAVLATCFFVRRHRVRHETPSLPVREFHGMSKRLVKAMPSLIFTSVLEDNCTSMTCAICLEDYNVGDKLRVLPCRHKFHAFCVDSWLTAWRSFCPVCKRDARTSSSDPPASECTLLLSSAASSLSSSTRLASFHSAASLTPSINSSPSQASIIVPNSFLSSAYIPNSHRSSLNNSPSISFSRNSVNLRHASSNRSLHSYLISPHSVGAPLSSSINSRYFSPYIPSSTNGSPSHLVESSGRPSLHPRHCNESESSFSVLASAESLPGC
ncbi:LOW QUALITY PROTEIN: receptor homology region, transmembrane domain- and RING domain-containing protein 2-like [Dioscorea cayenensis subsp. rotundata]|uniref:LOW QUALITY PROTEIN: receptor homology region, transmembrane domain- and RING domain-containing protein 2-like n=1 Tax=Dioscorea cayennensis subsp. rotundata TaxID=55577 RepID=A0AB40ARP7_DIOCR|nr:LOW QUALITY PROTEIN: receptor homology region, transmembrane domain- and RING domain-containing protein 2-like [Dioscorea cayenensis subsp. rotundata]